jgi:hypothetical protein
MRWSTKFNKGQLPKRKTFDKKNLFNRKTEDKTSVFNKITPQDVLEKIKMEQRTKQIKQFKIAVYIFLLLTIITVCLGFLYLG